MSNQVGSGLYVGVNTAEAQDHVEQLIAELKSLGLQSVYTSQQVNTSSAGINTAFGKISSSVSGLGSSAFSGLKSAISGVSFAPLQQGLQSVATSGMNAFSDLKNSLLDIKTLVAGLFVGFSLGDLIQTSRFFQQMQVILEATTGSSARAAGEYEFLRQTVQKYGLDLEAVGEQYTKLVAATEGTAMQGQKVRDVFEGFAAELSALHASGDQANRTFLDLQHIMALGVVQMREMRVLSRTIPDAMQLAATGMGMSVQQFAALIHSGKAMADDVLPAMAKAMKDRWGGAAVEAGNMTQGMLNRLHTSFLDFKKDIVDGGFDTGMSKALGGLVQALNSDKVKQFAKDIGSLLGDALKIAGNALAYLVDHINLVEGGFAAIVALKVGEWFLNVAEAVIGLGAAVLVNPWVALTAAIAVAITLLVGYRDSIIEVGGHTAALRDYTTVAWEGIKAAWQSLKEVTVEYWHYLGFVGDIILGIGKLFVGLVDIAGGVFKTIVDVGSTTLGALFEWIRHALSGEFLDPTVFFAGMWDKIKANFTSGSVTSLFSDIAGQWGELAGRQYASRMAAAVKTGTQNHKTELNPDSGITNSPDGKVKRDPVADEIRKLTDQVAYQKLLSEAWKQGKEAVQALTTAEEAQLIVDRLHLQNTDARAQKIRDLVKVLGQEKAATEDQKAYQNEIQKLNEEGQKLSDARMLRGLDNVALAEANALREVNAFLMQHGATLSADEIKNLKDKAKANADANYQLEHENHLRDDARQTIDAFRTPMDNYNLRVKQLNEELLLGALDWNTYSKAMSKAHDDLETTTIDMLKNGDSAIGGIRAAVMDYQKSTEQVGQNAFDVTQKFFQNATDTLTTFVTTGKGKFSDLFNSLEQDITRFVMRQLMSSALKQLGKLLGGLFGGNQDNGDGGGGGGGGGLGGFFGNFLGGLFGGSSGSGGGGGGGFSLGAGDQSAFDSGYNGFANGGIMTPFGPAQLRRYALGGVARTPQMAMFGEGSSPEAYVPLPDGRNIPVKVQGGGGGGVNISFNITTQDADSFRKSSNQIYAEASSALDRANRRNN